MTFGRSRTEYREYIQEREAAKNRRMREQIDAMKLAPRLHKGVYTGSTAGAAPKGEKAKPGKRSPTKEERAWMDAIVAYGCIACRMEGRGFVAPCVHHILRGGRRMGHLHTLPLCPGHHQDGTGTPGLVARHPYKARFEAMYGSEDSLLARLRAEIGATT